ncbi:hypothetical protein ACN47E_001385 [Coniothyrium glycines]
MSSGNPFRTSQLYKQSPVPQTSFINADNSVPGAPRGDAGHAPEVAVASPPPKTKKQVRIVSPTTPTSLHPDAFDAYVYSHDTVPPIPGQPQSAASTSLFGQDPTSRQSAGAGVSMVQDASGSQNMVTASGFSSSRSALNTPGAIVPSSTAPANPFSRTLASLEPQQENSGDDRTGTEGTNLGRTNTSLDVESFKNLLMTGKPTPGPSAQSAQSATIVSSFGGAQLESSSTDTSSISRQSFFEQGHEVHGESPRTSIDAIGSEEDDSMGLVSEVQKGRKKPPPAPKHRHGKLVTPRQPQTVSFDSFAASEPKPLPATRSRENSETNKPLPPLPTVPSGTQHITTQDVSQQQTSTSFPIQRNISTESEAPTLQKKIPPPIPLARRHSQLRTSMEGNRPRSNHPLAMSSQQSVDASPSPLEGNTDPSSVFKSPPPPPPRSRHGARLTNILPSSPNSSNVELPNRSESTRNTSSAQVSRSSSGGVESSKPSSPVIGIQRTSSVSSNRNSLRAVSGESTGSASMPPPPPPPRRRQSNRSSLDHQLPNFLSSSPTESRRTSTELRQINAENRRTSVDSKRRTSVASESSLRREYAPVEAPGLGETALYSPQEESAGALASNPLPHATRTDSSNILDDMEKFQREIDELRNRYKQTE